MRTTATLRSAAPFVDGGGVGVATVAGLEVGAGGVVGVVVGVAAVLPQAATMTETASNDAIRLIFT
jgi:hypothetical protein